MSNFAGVTFAEQNVTPSSDGTLYNAIFTDGILTGCQFSYVGSTLSMASGKLMVSGRLIRHVDASSWAIADAISGYARVVLTIDLTRTSIAGDFQQVTTEIEYATALDGFNRLFGSDINERGNKYQAVLCVVELSQGGISRIVKEMPFVSIRANQALFATATGIGDTLALPQNQKIAIPFGEWRSNTTDAFLFRDNAVVMPRDGAVEVSASVYFNSATSSAAVNAGPYIYKNGAEIAGRLDYLEAATAVQIAPIIVSVSAGDTLSLLARIANRAGTCIPNARMTFLSVRYITGGGAVAEAECDDCVKTVNGIAPDENGNVDISRLPVLPDGSGGEAGFSPIATVTPTADGAVISITDKTGTTTATVTNGTDGITPHIGSNGNWFLGEEDTGNPSRGERGNPGYPGTSASHTWDGSVLTITSASGISSADLKGPKGDSVGIKSISENAESGGSSRITFTDGNMLAVKNGVDGQPGDSVGIKSISESTESGGSSLIQFTDGKMLAIKNGVDGQPGAKGDRGLPGISGTSVRHTWDGSVLTITSGVSAPVEQYSSSVDLRGPKGDSVGIKSISENTESGGSSRITFTDGKMLAVKNGEDGRTPVKGKDYYTESDKAEFSTYIASELAKRGQLKPEFANSIEECTDTTKLYVLPDGYIYAYILTEVTTDGSKNYADPKSADWKTDSRLNSSNSVTALSGRCVTNYIKCHTGSTIRLKNLEFPNDTNSRAVFYDADKNALGGMAASTAIQYGGITADENGKHTTWAKLGATSPTGDVAASIANAEYVRFTLTPSDGKPIITVNEEIVDGSTEITYAWASTGHAFVPADYEERIVELEEASAECETELNALAELVDGLTERVDGLGNGVDDSGIPDYWQDHISDKITEIKTLQDAGGRDCFSFVVMTDMHYESNLGKLSPTLAKAIMDECGIKFCLCLGDTQTRHGARHDTDYIESEWTEIETMLSPIRDRLLITQGNHDGSYGMIDVNGDGTAEDGNGDGVVNEDDRTIFNLPPQKIYERIFRKVSTIDNVHFSEDGKGYYVDDTGSRVRYILLNTHTNKYELLDNGAAKYGNMRNFRFGQAQYDMVIEALTTVPTNGWSVIIASHVPLDRTAEYIYWGGEVDENKAQTGDPADCVIMQRMLNAYYNKTSYAGEFVGNQDGFDNVMINVDFSDAKGQLIAYFGGHVHDDKAWPPAYGWNGAEHSDFYIITSRCDGRTENTTELINERVARTTTEQSFDVFTVNKAERKIYATKIGAGSDRVISY